MGCRVLRAAHTAHSPDDDLERGEQEKKRREEKRRESGSLADRVTRSQYTAEMPIIGGIGRGNSQLVSEMAATGCIGWDLPLPMSEMILIPGVCWDASPSWDPQGTFSSPTLFSPELFSIQSSLGLWAMWKTGFSK